MNDVVFFPVATSQEDDLGQTVEGNEDFSRQVFCEKKSVSSDEFFKAGQNGLKAKYVFIVHLQDYQEEIKVKYGNNIYSIYRTYERKDEKVELYCEVKAGG
jgi:SPP1 family predicted phage head-tail adaptor